MDSLFNLASSSGRRCARSGTHHSHGIDVCNVTSPLSLSLSLSVSPFPSSGFRSQEPETHREFLAAYIMHGGETRQAPREKECEERAALLRRYTSPLPSPPYLLFVPGSTHTRTLVHLLTLGYTTTGFLCAHCCPFCPSAEKNSSLSSGQFSLHLPLNSRPYLPVQR